MGTHTIDLDEMLSWIVDSERSSVVYASSTRENKSLSVKLSGGYVVTHGKAVVYDGTDGSSAINAYNAISDKPVEA